MNKINKLNTESSDKFLKSISNVGAWTGLSRIFGLIRDISTTSLLGASVFHDIFVITLKIPNMFRRFFAEGAFNQAFVPIYADFQKNNDVKETINYLNSIAGFLITFLFFFSLLVLIFAPIFILIFAPGFYFDPIKKDIAVTTLRIMFPYLALISLVAFAGGIQNSHGKFSIPAATPMIFNLCLIISAVYVAPKYNMPVYVLAWGVLLAGFIQLLVQYFPLHTVDRIPRPKLNLDNTGLKKFLKLILPAILAGGIIQINLLIDTIFASLLETGSPTWLYVSDRLIQFPMGIFAIAIGTVLQFKVSEVYQSSYSLMAFSFGLPFFMLMKVLTPAFFARKDTKTPMYVALLSLLINATLNYVLAFIFDYGHVGIAIGSSVAALLSVLILEIILLRDGFIEIKNPLNRFNFAIMMASSFLILFLYNFTNKTELISMTQIERLIYLGFEIIIAISIYFIVARLVSGKSLIKQFN